MAKKIVYPSFIERRAAGVHFPPAHFDRPYNVIDQEETLENDRVVKKSVVKSVVPSEQMSGFVASDFYLENVIAAGAVSQLKECQYSSNDLDRVDIVGENVDKLINSIDQVASVDPEVKNNDVE